MERFEPTAVRSECDGLADGRELDRFTHARLWRNPLWLSARLNYLSMRFNVPVYGAIEQNFGVNRVEFVLLYGLDLHGDASASDIAVSTGFPKNTVSRAVAKLEREKLLSRRTDEGDKRSQRLAITKAGRDLVHQARPSLEKAEKAMLAALSIHERETLSLLLGKVILAMFEPGPAENDD